MRVDQAGDKGHMRDAIVVDTDVRVLVHQIGDDVDVDIDLDVDVDVDEVGQSGYMCGS